MISRINESFNGVFFDGVVDGARAFGRGKTGFERRGFEGARVVGDFCAGATGEGGCWSFLVALQSVACTGFGMDISEGSEPMPGLNGVRKGDLNGL